jgi:hypothetical protein
MPSLPELSSGAGLSSKQLQRAARTAGRGEIDVFDHQIGSWVQEQKDQIDSHALAGALKASLDAEIGLLDYGLELADGRQAALRLVGRKVAIAASIDDARIQRRFGR